MLSMDKLANFHDEFQANEFFRLGSMVLSALYDGISTTKFPVLTSKIRVWPGDY